MIHCGDITNIRGYDVEPVDVITFGSPCQDLSVAGKRAGLAGERSGLFMEATRIIKEMRKKTNGVYPKFAIWENVVGAFSSNGAEDFRAVLEELARCVESGAAVPRPPKGKWSKSGYIRGTGWSIAWRTFDAQYWGVPQRRRRIGALLCLDSECADQILFELEGAARDQEPRVPSWKEASGAPGNGDRLDAGLVDGAGIRAVGIDRFNQLANAEILGTLDTTSGYNAAVAIGTDLYNGAVTGSTACTLTASSGTGTASGQSVAIAAVVNDQGGGCINVMRDEISPTLRAQMGGHPPLVVSPVELTPKTLQIRSGKEGGGKGPLVAENMSACLTAAQTQTLQPVVYDARGNGTGETVNILVASQQAHVGDYTQLVVEPVYWDGTQTAGTPTASNARGSQRMPDKDNFTAVLQPVVENALGLDRASFNQGKNAQYDFTVLDDQQPTLTARGPIAVSYSWNDPAQYIRWIVRRLMPIECERLQGFPDGWTEIPDYIDENGKKKTASDTARYTALGNSIALPQWWWLVNKLRPYLPSSPTLASLFDGIGGFPLVWETAYGTGTARWASEIEAFPIAVTKYRFPEPEPDDWM